jgi:hypothetical protein
MISCCIISQARARYRYGLLFRAPTGQTSMMLPDSSWPTLRSIQVPISVRSPRPTVPSSWMPAISWPKRTQRVQ